MSRCRLSEVIQSVYGPQSAEVYVACRPGSTGLSVHDAAGQVLAPSDDVPFELLLSLVKAARQQWGGGLSTVAPYRVNARDPLLPWGAAAEPETARPTAPGAGTAVA